MNLKDIRNKAGLTQREVAQAAGIARESYTNIENGTRHPSVPVAKKLGAVLGFDWIELFEENEKEPPKGGGEV